MAGQCAEAQGSIVVINVRGARDEVQIHEMGRVRETQLHQRDEALSARQQLGVITKLGQHGCSLSQRTGAMIVKRSRIHQSFLVSVLRSSSSPRCQVRTKKSKFKAAWGQSA